MANGLTLTIQVGTVTLDAVTLPLPTELNAVIEFAEFILGKKPTVVLNATDDPTNHQIDVHINIEGKAMDSFKISYPEFLQPVLNFAEQFAGTPPSVSFNVSLN